MSLPPDPSDPGLNYTFSKPIQRSLASAAEAAGTEHTNVEPKHLLLGMLQVDGAVALNILDGLDVDPQEIIDRVEQTLGRGNPEDAVAERVPFTEEAKGILELALAEARILESIYVGTEHLLLALLRQEDTPACLVLNSSGVRMEEARAETQRVWQSGVDERGTGDNLADQAVIKVLRESLEDGDETVPEFVRRLGAADSAAWARFPDGSWKTWDDVDWDADGEQILRSVRDWQNRQERS